MFRIWLGVLSRFQGSATAVFRILLEVQPMLHDIVGNAVNVGSIATVLGYEGKCCQCFRIL